MDTGELDRLLEDLRRYGADHQTVEAKRARADLPDTLQSSLIAMANADGGTVLLGVDESSGFVVTGVEDPGRISAALSAKCSELEPQLRPRITFVEHSDGIVVVAEFPPISHDQRPCYRRSDGPHRGAFVRVGDSDDPLSSQAVDEMLAARSNTDHSRRPRRDATIDDLDAAEIAALAQRAGRPDEDQLALLRRFGALVDGDRVSVGGLLALGSSPETFSTAARAAYRRAPLPTDPAGTRYKATHHEGRVGRLLDDILDELHGDLPVFQVQRDGGLVDESDVPRQALREVVANALLHRSLSDAMESSTVSVEVETEAVVVASPGGLHPAAEPSQLGLAPLSNVRNHSLVRICEWLRTPSNQRIVENQASGIRIADEESRRAGTMPPIFVDRPASFQVYLMRGSLPREPADSRLANTRFAGDPDAARVITAALRLREGLADSPGSPLARQPLDAHFAARLLAPCALADAAALLRGLEDTGALHRRRTRRDTAWILPPDLDPAPATREGSPQTEPTPGTSKRQQRSELTRRQAVDTVVLALAGSETGELSSGEIGRLASWGSTATRSKWIGAAIDAGFVEATSDNVYDRTRKFRLTGKGRSYATRSRGDGS
jgi:ATP-dependent DNA helicase RecG